MKRVVIQLAAASALSLLSISCATTATSTHSPRHAVCEASDVDVEKAIQDAERSALARMTDSVDPETAQVARQLSLAEGR